MRWYEVQGSLRLGRHHVAQRGDRRQTERYLLAAARYLERNPVVAGLVSTPGDYPWSSTGHYLRKQFDPLIQQSPLGESVEDWSSFLATEVDAECRTAIVRAERSGRPLGEIDFVAKLVEQTKTGTEA